MKHDVRLRPLLSSGEPQLYARALEDVARDVVLLALTGTDPQAYPALLGYPEEYSPPSPPDPPPDPTPDPDPAPTGEYTGSTKKEAMLKAILGTCRPCCGSGSGAGSGTQFCGCTICCTLDGTIEMGDGGTGYDAGIDFTMTCNNTFTTSSYISCFNEDTEDTYCYVVTTTYAGGSGTGLSFSFGAFSGTYDWQTTVWVSDAITIDGESYRVYFTVTSYDVTYVTPAPSTSQLCAWEWGIQRLYTPPVEDCCGTQWGTVYSIASGSSNFSAVKYTTTADPDLDSPCIDGYYENGGESCGAPAWCDPVPPGYVAAATGNDLDNSFFNDCVNDGMPIMVTHASMFCPFPAGTCPTDPSAAIKCFRITFADNC